MTEIMAVLTDNDARFNIKHDFLQIQAEIQSWICANVSLKVDRNFLQNSYPRGDFSSSISSLCCFHYLDSN